MLAQFLTLDSVNLCVRLVADVISYSFFYDAKYNNERKYRYDNIGLVYRDSGEKITDGYTKPNNIPKFCKLQKES